jgi:benzoate/toluate 1,2-dioxygenase beta subunit
VIDEAWYGALLGDFADWREPLHDEGLQRRARSLLETEARLLDQGRLDEWLALYAAECVYWMPARLPAGDPRREVTIAFDDRRRLEDRVFRLKTGNAWSQAPRSRTVHLMTNVEVFRADLVRANLLISEFRAGETRLWSGWCGYRLREGRIEVKQVNLIDCDQNLRNPSFIF